MESLLRRPSVLGLIGTLVLIAMVSVPVYGAYERGPVEMGFDNLGCTGEPLYVSQLVTNETLDRGLGACVNVSESASLRYTCENGEFGYTQYLGSDDCSGFAFFTTLKTNLCFPGIVFKKRDGESRNADGKVDFSRWSKRAPGDGSFVIVCSAGESWTLVDNAPVNTTVPELTKYTTGCPSVNNCTAGSFHITSYNATGRSEPTCDQPLASYEFAGGAIVGDCYQSDGYNMRVECDAHSAYFETLPYGCDGPVMQRQGQATTLSSDTCERNQDEDSIFTCPRVVPSAPSTPTATTPSSASLQSPHLCFFFLSMAFIAAISLF